MESAGDTIGFQLRERLSDPTIQIQRNVGCPERRAEKEHKGTEKRESVEDWKTGSGRLSRWFPIADSRSPHHSASNFLT